MGTEAEVVTSYHHIHLVASDKHHSPLYTATIPFKQYVLLPVWSCLCFGLMQAIYTSHSRWLCVEVFQGRNCYSPIYRQTALSTCTVTLNITRNFLRRFVCSSVCIILSYTSDNGVWGNMVGELGVWSSSPFHRQLRDGWCCKSHTQTQLSQVLAFRPSYLDIPPCPHMTPHYTVAQN